MLFSVEQAFVGREEIRAPLKTSAWEATHNPDRRATLILGTAFLRTGLFLDAFYITFYAENGSSAQFMTAL